MPDGTGYLGIEVKSLAKEWITFKEEKGQWKSENERLKAVFLLHYDMRYVMDWVLKNHINLFAREHSDEFKSWKRWRKNKLLGDI